MKILAPVTELPASLVGGSTLNLPHGTAPSVPADGDVWTTTTGLYVRVNGTTVGPLASSSGGAAWGTITGTLSSQTDLQSALDLKAPLASPTFTGTVTAPTIVGTDTTDASSSTTGALKTAGGLGVAKKLYVGSSGVFTGTVEVATPTAGKHAVTKNWVNSLVMNLVANGSALLGDNTNFSDMTFNAVEAYSGGGSFTTTSYSTYKTTDDLIPVAPSKTYRMQWALKQLGTAVNAKAYGLVTNFDIDTLQISPNHTMFQPDTHTTLAQDLKPGDTTVYLTSAANWNNAAGANGHFRTIIVWGYTNSKGYTYPDYTYSRISVINAYADGGVDTSTNTITLSSPWPSTWGTLPAGRALSNGSSGTTFKYIAGANVSATSTWTTYTGEIGDIDTSGNNATYRFSPGTAFVKVGFLLNRDVANSQMAVSAVSFTEVAAGNLRTMTRFDLNTSGVDWFQVKTNGSTPALSVDVANNRVGINKTGPSYRLDVAGTGRFTGALTLSDSTDSSSSLTGSVTIAGGLGIAKKLYVGTDIYLPTDSANIVLGSNPNTGSRLRIHRSGSSGYIDFSGTLYLRPNGAGTYVTTLDSSGDLAVTGNTSVGGNLSVTGDLTINGTTTTVNSITVTRASSTTAAGLRIPHGTAPTTPTNGDVWTTTAGIYVRINGSTVGPLGAPTGTSWGSITGTLSSQTDLQSALDAKAPLASPTFTGTPAAPTATAGTNTTQVATTAYVRGEISALVASAPSTLDTLNELAAALGNDANFSTTVTTSLGNKADKIGSGDIEITDDTKGVILKSANGTRYRITVDDAGSLTTTAL